MISVDAATRIYHFAFPHEWLAAQSQTHYQPAAFDAEGFIHLATEPQIAGVVERHLRGHGPRVRLMLDPLQCGDSLLWEWSNASADVYPHLTAPIPLATVIEAVEFNPDAP